MREEYFKNKIQEIAVGQTIASPLLKAQEVKGRLISIPFEFNEETVVLLEDSGKNIHSVRVEGLQFPGETESPQKKDPEDIFQEAVRRNLVGVEAAYDEEEDFMATDCGKVIYEKGVWAESIEKPLRIDQDAKEAIAFSRQRAIAKVFKEIFGA